MNDLQSCALCDLLTWTSFFTVEIELCTKMADCQLWTSGCLGVTFKHILSAFQYRTTVDVCRIQDLLADFRWSITNTLKFLLGCISYRYVEILAVSVCNTSFNLSGPTFCPQRTFVLYYNSQNKLRIFSSTMWPFGLCNVLMQCFIIFK